MDFSGPALIFSNQLFTLGAKGALRGTARSDGRIHLHISQDCAQGGGMQGGFLRRCHTVFTVNVSADRLFILERLRQGTFPAPGLV